MSSRILLLAVCMSCLILRSSAATRQGGSYLRTKVDDIARDSTADDAWTYGCVEGLSGPSHWGDLSPDWATCNQGKSQSPIQIQTGVLESSKKLLPFKVFSSSESSLPADIATATIHNRVFQLNIRGWSILLDQTSYGLVQIRFHTPAEHRVDGAIYPLEMQHEFVSKDGKIAILSVFYKYSTNYNPYISQYFQYLPLLKHQSILTNVTVPLHLAPEDTYPYYLYEGSLARPPCTEGVTWIIAQNVKLLSQSQFEDLKSIKGSSNRPTQPLNGRKVFVPAY
nr:carbonic anhydrase-like 1a [Phlegmariurus tetrastichus]